MKYFVCVKMVNIFFFNYVCVKTGEPMLSPNYGRFNK